MHAAALVVVSGNPIARELKVSQLDLTSNILAGHIDCAVNKASHECLTQGEHCQTLSPLQHATVVKRAPEPSKPSLGKTFTQGTLNMVSEWKKSSPQSVQFQQLTHDRLLAVLDRMDDEIANWTQLATVAEESGETEGMLIVDEGVSITMSAAQAPETEVNTAQQPGTVRITSAHQSPFKCVAKMCPAACDILTSRTDMCMCSRFRLASLSFLRTRPKCCLESLDWILRFCRTTPVCAAMTHAVPSHACALLWHIQPLM
jgi:hypothetical protein